MHIYLSMLVCTQTPFPILSLPYLSISSLLYFAYRVILPSIASPNQIFISSPSVLTITSSHWRLSQFSSHAIKSCQITGGLTSYFVVSLFHLIRPWNEWVNQAYSRLSTTHGHITDCKLDSVVYAGVFVWVVVDLSCLGRTIYARQFFGCQVTDSVPPHVSRKESLRPFILTPSRPVGYLTH